MRLCYVARLSLLMRCNPACINSRAVPASSGPAFSARSDGVAVRARCCYPRTTYAHHHDSCASAKKLDKSCMSSEADEVARLKAELAALQQETATREEAQKAKRKRRKKRKTTEDDEAASSAPNLEAVDAEPAALTGAPPPPEKKSARRTKKAKNAPAADAPPARKKRRRRKSKRPTRTRRPRAAPTSAACPSTLPKKAWRIIFETLCGDLEKVEIQGFEDNPERCCGIAYVTFVEPDSLDRALTLDGESFKGDGRTMKIRRIARATNRGGRRHPRIAGSLTVYVGNMPWAASKEEVETMLSDAGCAVSSMRYHTDAETGQFRGFVHAELADESSLSNALALAGTRWRGRELRVSHSETGKKRSSRPWEPWRPPPCVPVPIVGVVS